MIRSPLEEVLIRYRATFGEPPPLTFWAGPTERLMAILDEAIRSERPERPRGDRGRVPCHITSLPPRSANLIGARSSGFHRRQCGSGYAIRRE